MGVRTLVGVSKVKYYANPSSTNTRYHRNYFCPTLDRFYEDNEYRTLVPAINMAVIEKRKLQPCGYCVRPRSFEEKLEWPKPEAVIELEAKIWRVYNTPWFHGVYCPCDECQDKLGPLPRWVHEIGSRKDGP